MEYTSSLARHRLGRGVLVTSRRIRLSGIVLFFAAHAGLALIMFQVEMIATVHALLALSVGLWWALNGRLEHTAYVAAYVAGAEVLWRMTDAGVFWEYGKYAIVFLFIVALIRTRRLKPPFLPLAYFLLLLPSAWLTVEQINPGLARQLISFNLSGPLALFVAAWFFSQMNLTIPVLRRLFLAVIAPVIGIAANTAFNTVTATELTFTTVSNFATSGGFGPNQVSAMLGLGALLALFYLIINRRISTLHKWVIGGILLWFVFQSALTFSRGGLAIAFGAAVAASLFLFRDGRSRTVVLAVTVILFLFTQYVMFPVLDDFTAGMFTERYTDTSPTGRDEIALMDLKIFQDHPLLGVGPGRGSVYRDVFSGGRVAAHTEFTRLFAEHGLLGIIALLVGLLVGWKNFRRARTPKGQSLIAGMLTWTLLFMLINGFRIVAPALLFGISFATLLIGEDNQASRRTAARYVKPTGAPYT